MAIGTLFKFSKIFVGLYKYWWILYFLFLVLPAIVQSVDAGIEQEDWRIPIKTLAIQTTSFEKGIYDAVQDMEIDINKKDGLDEQIDEWWNLGVYIFRNLWRPIFAMVFTFLLIFKSLRWLNDSLKWRALYITFGIMFLLQILVVGVPFKGSFALIKFIIEVARQL